MRGAVLFTTFLAFVVLVVAVQLGLSVHELTDGINDALAAS